MWSQLDFPNLIAGVVIGLVPSIVFYLIGSADAAAQRKVDAKNIQLILRAVEQSGGEVRFVRDETGAIVNVSVELSAAGRATSTATAELSVKPQGQ